MFVAALAISTLIRLRLRELKRTVDETNDHAERSRQRWLALLKRDERLASAVFKAAGIDRRKPVGESASRDVQYAAALLRDVRQQRPFVEALPPDQVVLSFRSWMAGREIKAMEIGADIEGIDKRLFSTRQGKASKGKKERLSGKTVVSRFIDYHPGASFDQFEKAVTDEDSFDNWIYNEDNPAPFEVELSQDERGITYWPRGDESRKTSVNFEKLLNYFNKIQKGRFNR